MSAAYPSQNLFCLFTMVNRYIMTNNGYNAIKAGTLYFIIFLLHSVQRRLILISCLSSLASFLYDFYNDFWNSLLSIQNPSLS